MGEPNRAGMEIRKIRRLLKEIGKIAEDASLTGSFKEAARTSAQQYNSILQHLEKIGLVPTESFFRALPEDAKFDEVGVAARQLAGYLAEEEIEEEARGERPAVSGSHNVYIGGFGGLKELKDLKELKELGQVIREHLPEWLKGKVPGKERESESQQSATSLTEIESRLAEVGGKLQAVAEQLRRGDLTDAQRAELAENLSRLGQEQARLAREHAMLREKQQASQ